MKLSRRAGRYALLAVAAAAYLSCAFLMYITVYSSDDYWYSTFLDSGLARWAELTRYHYETFNGRVLVHAVAQVILHFGNWFFALAGTALCVLMPAAASRAEGAPRRRLPAALLVFGAGLLAMPGAMITHAFMWISAFCNYALPTAMCFGLVWLLSRALGRERMRAADWAACVPAGFLCGATTEQSGLVALCIALFFCLCALAKRRGALPGAFLTALAAAAGLYTIFLSPATRSRFGQETDTGSLAGLLQSISDGFEVSADILGGGLTTAALLAALFAAGGIVLARLSRRRAAAPVCLVPAAAAAAAPFCTGGVRLALVAAALISAAALALVLLRYGRRTSALLLLAGVASFCVMLPTNSAGERMLMPFHLYALGAACLLIPEAMEPWRAPLSALLPALAACALIALRVPLFSACWGNHQVEALNRGYEEAARESGELWYCMDYDMACTHTKPFNDAYFYGTWLESAGFPGGEGVKVYLYSEELPAVYVNGERLTSPALKGEDGWLLPLRGIVEALGGILDVRSDGIGVALPHAAFSISYPSLNTAEVSGSGGGAVVERSTNYYLTCLGESAFTEVMGLTVEENGGVINVSLG